MKYPMITKYDPFLGEVTREMLPKEYEAKLQWYKNYIENHKNDTAPREREYVAYLKRWFGTGICDGFESFKTRHMFHQLPMAFNVYFN